MRSYVIGRSPYADIVLPDPSVARRHAELVATDDGRFYLTDCATETGSWRRAADDAAAGAPDTTGAEPRWERLRQAFVSPEEPLRFGEHQATLSALLGLAGARESGGAGRWRWEAGWGTEAESAGAAGAAGGDAARPRRRVERDPVTGEIVAKRW